MHVAGVRVPVSAVVVLACVACAAPTRPAHWYEAPARPAVPDSLRWQWALSAPPQVTAADVFVLPSYREGMPNSLLEAGAMGLPSITTAIPGCAEVVIDGENGLLAPPKDEAALEHALRRLATEPALTAGLAAASRPSIVRRYDQQVFWNALEQYYAEILAAVAA